jgi:hypothetical protein
MGAVSTPDDDTVPTVADHVTEALKFPVPETCAAQFAVLALGVLAGQVTVTAVMVGDAGAGGDGDLLPHPTLARAMSRNRVAENR